MKYHREETSQSMTPQKALQFLQEGNQRFVSNIRVNRDMIQLVNETKDQQFPFAAILSCSDSRTSAELIFDQGLGDIFSVRLAGNIASPSAIASIEFACLVLGAKLIMVLGHSGCGAIKGACDGADIGHLPHLMEHIKPAVEMEKETLVERHSKNKEFVERVAHHNVVHQIHYIFDRSQILREMLESGKIGIVGGMYDLQTGIVAFDELLFHDPELEADHSIHLQSA